MAEWSNATMTDVGADLQAKVNAGKTKLTFTKIKVGSGVNATNPLALTDVIASKWETTNFTVKRDGKIVTVDTFITNTGIKKAFRMSEIGLFARDPDKGEVLYAYLTDPEPDRMPAEGGSAVVSQELSLGMTFSNSGNVTLTVNMGALVTREQLDKHNTDPHAHDNRFKALEQTTQSLTNKVNGALDKKYDKTGGNLSGDIVFTGNRLIRTDGNNTGLQIHSSDSWKNGAHINLLNSNTNGQDKGSFSIVASANNAYKYLIGRIDGRLTWDGDDIIRQGMLATKDTTSALSQAPTLQLVKSLLSGLNTKSSQDVIDALGAETLRSLGVKYDFSNEKAWYICLGKLFGGLIIQGGMYYSNYNKEIGVAFPITYKSKCLFVVKNACGGNALSGNNVLYREWTIYSVDTIGFTVASTNPATDVYYLSMGY